MTLSELPTGLGAAAAARERVRDASSCGWPEGMVDDAALAASEAVIIALARGAALLSIDVDDAGDRLWVEVLALRDASIEEQPERQVLSEEILDAVTERWGVREDDGRFSLWLVVAKARTT